MNHLLIWKNYEMKLITPKEIGYSFSVSKGVFNSNTNKRETMVTAHWNILAYVSKISIVVVYSIDSKFGIDNYILPNLESEYASIFDSLCQKNITDIMKEISQSEFPIRSISINYQ